MVGTVPVGIKDAIVIYIFGRTLYVDEYVYIGSMIITCVICTCVISFNLGFVGYIEAMFLSAQVNFMGVFR